MFSHSIALLYSYIVSYQAMVHFTVILNDLFSLVSCPSLTDPSNGVIKCSLGDDGVPSYEDTCSYTCNTGYELTGSDTRSCQSNRRWSGSDGVCKRGELVN